MTVRPRRSRRPSPRWWAWSRRLRGSRAAFFLALLSLASWVSGATGARLHEVVEQHVLCEEHGRIEDVVHDDGTSDPEPAAGKAVVPGYGHHDDCPFVGLARAGLDRVALPAAPLFGGWRSEVERLPDLRGPPVSPLRFAPKTSPPARS